jgi:CHAT domain-containing protein
LHTNAEGFPANSAELRNDLNWTIFAPVANFWGAILQVVIAAATPTMINSRRFDVVARLFFVLLTMIFPTWTWAQQTASTPQDYVPVELQASSPEIKVYLDTAEKLSREGSYSESFQQLKNALDLCTSKGLVADKPLIEAKLGAASFVQGKLDDAKEYWVHSLSDSQSASNLVLQADVLVAISSMAQSAGNLTEALDLLTKALDLARKSKNLFIQSRCLGELGRLQLTQGKGEEARASIEEALRIDRLNHYKWEASHTLYLAWVTSPDNTNLDQAITLVRSARDLAIKYEDYLTFMQASTSLGQALVQKGKLSEGIGVLEHSRGGNSEDGKPLFQRPAAYEAAMSLPYPRVVFLEALAMAYQTGQRPDDALKSWQELYDLAHSAGFTLAAAEAASKMAAIYSSKKEPAKAISYYSLAEKAWKAAGNTPRRIDALTSEASLLFQQGEGDKSVEIDEELLPLQKSSKNSTAQFITYLAMAEILQPKSDLDRTAKALKNAESLLSQDLTLPNVEPKLVLELYGRECDLADKQGNPLQALIALEKAMLPAGTAVDVKAMAYIEQQVKKRFIDFDLRNKAIKAHDTGDFGNALVYYELLDNFDLTDAIWNDKVDDYRKNGTENFDRLLNLPFKVISQPDGAITLERNLEEMGPVTKNAKLSILWVLSNHYMFAQRPDMVVKFATAALPSLRLGEHDQPNRWDVEISCELAYSLMIQKDLDAAADKARLCLQSSKNLGDPGLLNVAHQTNVWVLQAMGKQSEAQESEQFLLQHTPEDPQHYVELAQLQAQQGKSSEAIQSWQKALQLFETKKDKKGVASTRLSLAGAITLSKGSNDNNDVRENLEQALTLYRQIGDGEGQIRASMFLGEFFGNNKDIKKAREYFDKALKLSREFKRADLEAGVLSEAGQAYARSGAPDSAIEYYKNSADIYHSINDLADEAFQLRNEAWALNDLHKADEAFEIAVKAKVLADSSGSWVARYWIRRALAAGYENRGEFENAIFILREARTISDSAHQQLNSAQTSLALAEAFIDVGGWEDARDAINLSLPIFRQFNDKDSEISAYADLMNIYGARESGLKDFDKALENYEAANRMTKTDDPARTASLALGVEEIYWQQKRFKDAIAKVSEALDYYVRTKDDWDEGNALITLAEAQRSDGDLQAASRSLARAEPLVKRIHNFYMTGRLYYGQANLLKALGQFRSAIEQYQRVVSLLEQIKSDSDLDIRRKASENYGFIYGELVDTYYLLSSEDVPNKSADADNALRYSELNKSRIFTNSWGRTFIDVLKLQIPTQLQQREQAVSDRQNALRSELAQSISGQGHRTEKDVREELGRATNDELALANDLHHANPAYAEARYPQPVSISSLPLHADETFIEFKMLDESLLVWIISGSQDGPRLVAFYKVPHPRVWYEERVLEIRDAFNRGQPSEFDPQISEQLFEGLFPGSFAQYVTAAKSIIFVPDDILFLLPFEVLSPNASKSEYALLTTPTSYFPSAGAFRLLREIVRTKREWPDQFFGLADPVVSTDDPRYSSASILSTVEVLGTQSTGKPNQPVVRSQLSVHDLKTRGYVFRRLPNTETEVRHIAALFPTTATVRTGADARKLELLQTDLGRFKFVHFATHGFFPVEPGIREPALVLSYDGEDEGRMMLTLSEILQLKLHSEMVVLSACNTGSGRVTRAEGVASLGTAFLAAGASSVTVSLWKVEDQSTSALMQEFYRNLLKGMSKNSALAAARSTLFAQGHTNPFFWAPFVLTGE